MTTRRATLRTPAKINLDLRVLGKRPDGYHELRTVFHTISLADRIEIAFTRARRTEIEIASTVTIDGPNLVEKAARLVLDHLKIHGRVEFRLKKKIPMGAGLGGGSTNAAAVLLALPALAGGKRIGIEALAEMGTSLGSDIPFFLYGGAAMGAGRGEELYPLPDIKLGPMLLVCPEVHSSTPEAYRALARPALTSILSSRDTNNFRSSVWDLAGGLSSGQSALCVNDFESVVFSRYPQLAKIKGQLLKLGGMPALMSGSGSSLFGVFRTSETRERARVAIEKSRVTSKERIFAVTLLSRSRYEQMWRRQLLEHVVESDPLWPPRSRYAR
jgi:4-diphosphocytidyl-2-C-methyl-D-erythritol kinase